jgi:hypothetical protein
MSRFRTLLFLLAALALVGCGYGSKNYMNGNGMPQITGINPQSVMADSPTFTLTVNGSGFGTDSVVYWNGSVIASTYKSGTQVMAQVPAADLMNMGNASVQVHSGGMFSNMVTFTVQ